MSLAKPTQIPPLDTLMPPKDFPLNVRPITERPRPLASLTASASRLTSEKLTGRIGGQGLKAEWQGDAWDMYELVGEQRFLATTLAARLAQAKFYVGEMTESDLDAPEPVEDALMTDLLDALGEGAAGRAQLIYRLAVNLYMAGDGWLVGVPPRLLPQGARLPSSINVQERDIEEPDPTLDATGAAVEEIDVLSLHWMMLSVSEIATNNSGEVTLKIEDGSTIKANPDDLVMIRVWRSHPARAWEADSPVRSSLPVLRELVGLTMHISAQVDSRLAGAGLLIVPQSAKKALAIAAGLPEDSEEDLFTEALIEAMLTPIGDRSSASAMVPLVITVPDALVDSFQHLTFATPLDGEARNLREEAIRRLALGQDAPPELLLGTAGMNHWGAWLVQEDVVTTHLEPPLALICDALTSQYLWPVLIEQGMTPEAAHKFVIWYDVSDLVVRPNRSADALELHGRGAISDEALLHYLGFDPGDAPETAASMDPAVAVALDLVKAAPTLAQVPGIGLLVEQIRAVMSGASSVPEGPSAEGDLPPGQLPTEPPTEGEPPSEGEMPAAPAEGA